MEISDPNFLVRILAQIVWLQITAFAAADDDNRKAFDDGVT